MNSLKKILRVLALTLIIILASAGVGMTGAILPNNRERYLDNEIRTEQVDKKKEDEEQNEIKKTKS